MGFITWQGRRVLVPSWFGAPRLVPAAADEVRILKLNYRMCAILVAYIVALFVAGTWLPIDAFVLGGAILQLGIPLILGIHVVLERRCFDQWPAYTTSRFSRSQFMLSYFSSLPVRGRFYEFCWGLFGLWLFGRAFVDGGGAALASPGDVWASARLAFAGLVLAGLSLATFLAARYALLAALALMPRVRLAR